MLTRYYGVSVHTTGLYLLPFALGNFLGPVALGHFFDTLGRRQMIAGDLHYRRPAVDSERMAVYARRADRNTQSDPVVGDVLLRLARGEFGLPDRQRNFSARDARAGDRGLYSAGTAVGGVVAPWFFGRLIDSQSRTELFWGYLVAAVLMLAAGMAEATLGIAAERTSLEKIAAPLSSAR